MSKKAKDLEVTEKKTVPYVKVIPKKRKRYNNVKYHRSCLTSVDCEPNGESIERKVERIVHNGEPIQDGSPEIFTARKDGVKPEHDIRTDRFEIAADAMDAASRSIDGARQKKAELKVVKDDDVSGAKSTEGSSSDGQSNSK